MTEGKFGIKPAAVFIVNNSYGPDILGAFLQYDNVIYLFFHGIGWPVFALLMTLLFYYMVNAKVYKFRTGKSALSRVHMLEKEKRMPYWRVYLFVAAAGLMHQLIDLIGHPSFIDYDHITNAAWGAVWFGDNAFLSLDWVLSTGVYPGGFYPPALALSVVGYITFLLSIFWGIRSKNFKNMAKGMLFVIFALLVLFTITYFMIWPGANAWLLNEYDGVYTYPGDKSHIPLLVYITGGEADLGVMVFMGLFFFIPLIMVYYGFRDLPKGEVIESESGSFGDKKPATKEAPAPYLK